MMIKKLISLTAVFMFFSIANANLSEINSAYELLQMQEQAKRKQNKLVNSLEQEFRLRTIKEYAYTTAIRVSMNTQLSKANKQIKEIERELDSIYNFEPLMIKGRVIPPVITESKEIYTQNSPNQIRLSGAVYDIYSQSKFSSTAPNWRQYLTFQTDRDAYENIVFPATGLEPKTKQEKDIWIKATNDGWEQGIIQANHIIQNAMDKLNRDYTGMIRFYSFLRTGKISSPIINTYELYDTNTGERLILDEQLLQIESLPQFKNAKQYYKAKENVSQEDRKFLTSLPSQAEVLTNEYTDIDTQKTLEKIHYNEPISEPNFADIKKPFKPLSSENITVTITKTYQIVERKDPIMQNNKSIPTYDIVGEKTNILGAKEVGLETPTPTSDNK